MWEISTHAEKYSLHADVPDTLLSLSKLLMISKEYHCIVSLGMPHLPISHHRGGNLDGYLKARKAKCRSFTSFPGITKRELFSLF
jgi:hypothetical protein